MPGQSGPGKQVAEIGMDQIQWDLGISFEKRWVLSIMERPFEAGKWHSPNYVSTDSCGC